MDMPHHPPFVHGDAARLREEIAYMEARLEEIGHDGDCAYEKAMIRFFEQELTVRREHLRAA